MKLQESCVLVLGLLLGAGLTAGAWTGKLVTGETSGAEATGKLQPKDESARSLFRKWQANARINGKIPGGALRSLAAAASNFVKHNPTDERAPKLAELLRRIDMSRDWTQEDAVALLDDVTAIYSNLPKWAEDLPRFSIAEVIRTGQPLPAELKNAPWGEAQPNGLRAAWLLEPRAQQHPLNTPLKSRILFHNTGKNSVVFRVLTWNQSSGHKARGAKGAEIKISATYWTTIPQIVACRLGPGEFTEVAGAGIGVGANKDNEDWRGTRVGAWIEAKEGDEVNFSPVPVSADGNDGRARPHGQFPWWPAFITRRLNRDAPLPADAAERKRLLDRAIRDLFGTAPSPEETATFLADRTPDAMGALAKRLAQRAGTTPFTGTLQSGETKFRVLPVDPEAAKKPRVATGPGRYTLGDNVRLVIVRKGRVNEADIRFFSSDRKSEPPGKSHEIKLPDGYLTWAIAWERGSTVLWAAEKGVLHSYDFTNPAQVKETRIEPAGITNVPEPLREALRSALEGSSNASAQPAATPAWLACIGSWVWRGCPVPRWVHVFAAAMLVAGIAAAVACGISGIFSIKLMLSCLLVPPAAAYVGWLWMFGPSHAQDQETEESHNN